MNTSINLSTINGFRSYNRAQTPSVEVRAICSHLTFHTTKTANDMHSLLSEIFVGGRAYRQGMLELNQVRRMLELPVTSIKSGKQLLLAVEDLSNALGLYCLNSALDVELVKCRRDSSEEGQQLRADYLEALSNETPNALEVDCVTEAELGAAHDELNTILINIDSDKLSTSELIAFISDAEPSDYPINIDTNRAKNLLELAARKLRKDDTTADWTAVAQAALINL